MQTDVQKQLDEMKKEIERLKNKRIYQQDIVPDIIKTRHMGEANRYIMFGLEADRPDGFSAVVSTTMYFATDTLKLWVWDGTTYRYVQFI